MASLDSLETRVYSAQTLSGRSTDDLAPAIEIVALSTTLVPVVTLDSADPAAGLTLACTGYTTGNLAFGTFTNLGLLVDEINANHGLYFKARIMDGLRSTSTASTMLLPDSAITAVTVNGESIFKVFTDTSELDELYYRVAMDRGVLKDDNGVLKSTKVQGDHRVKITGIKFSVNNTVLQNGVRIYEYNPIGQTEVQIWGNPTVDDTETTKDFTLNPITASPGNELVVMLKSGAITSTPLLNFLQVDYVRE